MSGVPVVIADRGFPVRPVESGAPLLTVATNGFGAPIVIDEVRGTPFVVEGLPPEEGEGEPEPELWTIGDWTAGDATTLSIAGGRARATRAGGNPRISRQVSGLDEGVSYRVETTGYVGTAGSVFFRISADANLSSGDYVNIGGAGAIDQTFTAPAGGTVYVGIVGVASEDGQYVETDEEFTFTLA